MTERDLADVLILEDIEGVRDCDGLAHFGVGLFLSKEGGADLVGKVSLSGAVSLCERFAHFEIEVVAHYLIERLRCLRYPSEQEEREAFKRWEAPDLALDLDVLQRLREHYC